MLINLKPALLLLCAQSTDPRFEFPDVDQLTVFAGKTATLKTGESNVTLAPFDLCIDNVLPAVLRQLGVIKVSDELAKKIEEGKHIPFGNLIFT